MCKETKRFAKLLMMLLVTLVGAAMFTGVKDAKAASKPTVKVTKRTTTTATIKISKTRDTGYQVYVATSKHGKYKLVMATMTQSYKILNLKKSKTYYVKVRGYRTRGYRISRGKYSSAVKISAYKKTVKPTTTTTTDTEDITTYTTDALTLVNAERASRGLEALTTDAALCRAADVRAQEIATVFDHMRPDGTGFETAVDEQDFGLSYVTEDIYSGMQNVSDVIATCMQDSVRVENAIATTNTKMAVGCYYNPANATYYWVLLFAE